MKKLLSILLLLVTIIGHGQITDKYFSDRVFNQRKNATTQFATVYLSNTDTMVRIKNISGNFGGFKHFTRVFFNKDSIPIVTALGNNYVSILDTVTGQYNRILASNLGFMLPDTASWTPSGTNVSNFSSLIIIKATYTRIGNKVDCWLQAGIDCTTGSTETEFQITLPVASNLAINGECFGEMIPLSNVAAERSAQLGYVYGDATTDKAVLHFKCNTNASFTENIHNIHFWYQIN